MSFSCPKILSRMSYQWKRKTWGKVFSWSIQWNESLPSQFVRITLRWDIERLWDVFTAQSKHPELSSSTPVASRQVSRPPRVSWVDPVDRRSLLGKCAGSAEDHSTGAASHCTGEKRSKWRHSPGNLKHGSGVKSSPVLVPAIHLGLLPPSRLHTLRCVSSSLPSPVTSASLCSVCTWPLWSVSFTTLISTQNCTVQATLLCPLPPTSSQNSHL